MDSMIRVTYHVHGKEEMWQRDDTGEDKEAGDLELSRCGLRQSETDGKDPHAIETDEVVPYRSLRLGQLSQDYATLLRMK